jgi:hypothetical protein
MKYRTVIQLVCDAADREDAIHMAGEYLRGELDFGVNMKCDTTSVRAHRARKYFLSCLVLFTMLSALAFKVMPVADGASGGLQVSKPGYSNTFTILPALKTKHKADFRKEWDEKKYEAMMDFLKK